MGDKAKKLATLIGVAALVFSGVGIAVVAGTGVGLGTALGVTAFGGLSLGALAAIGGAALSFGSIPTPIEETGANQRGQPHADAGTLGDYVFGTTLVHMPLLYEEQTGAAPDRVLHDIFCHAWHRINAYVSLTIPSNSGPEAVSFSGNAATGSYSNLVWWFRATGTQTTQPFSGHPFDANNWPSSAVGRGMAMSALVWNVDDDAFVAKFQGMPSSVEIVVQGALLYDPRLDTTAGGSGTQRFDNPSTWTFNNGNAVLVLLRFMIGEYSSNGSLIWGRGIEETDYDVDNFIAMANIADETRDGKPRYRLGGAHHLDGSWEGFVRQWEAETGGKVSKSGGVYRVWLPHDDLTPLTTITESDLLAGASIEHVAANSVDKLYNTARGRYIEPTQGYKAFTYPEVVEDNLVDDDGGRKRPLNYDFSWVQDYEIAQRTARQIIRRSRFQRLWTVPIGWKGYSPDYRPFTVHTLNCAETNFEDQLVRVVDRRMGFNGAVVLVLQQEDETLYDDTVPLLDPHANNDIPTRLDRLGTTTPRRVDAESDTAADVEIDDVQHTPDGQGFNTTVLSIAYTPKATGTVVVTVSGTAQYTFATGGFALDLQYSIQEDEAYDGFQEQHWYIPNPANDGLYQTGISVSRTFTVTAGVAKTFKFMAAKFQEDDEVHIVNAEMQVIA